MHDIYWSKHAELALARSTQRRVCCTYFSFIPSFESGSWCDRSSIRRSMRGQAIRRCLRRALAAKAAHHEARGTCHRAPTCSFFLTVCQICLTGRAVSWARQEAVAKLEANREEVLKYKEHEDRKIGGVKSACAELADTCVFCPGLGSPLIDIIHDKSQLSQKRFQ